MYKAPRTIERGCIWLAAFVSVLSMMACSPISNKSSGNSSNSEPPSNDSPVHDAETAARTKSETSIPKHGKTVESYENHHRQRQKKAKPSDENHIPSLIKKRVAEPKCLPPGYGT